VDGKRKQEVIKTLKEQRDKLVSKIMTLQESVEYGSEDTVGCPIFILEAQLNAMRTYVSVLRVRIRTMGDLT
jgi:hypothetical protein